MLMVLAIVLLGVSATSAQTPDISKRERVADQLVDYGVCGWWSIASDLDRTIPDRDRWVYDWTCRRSGRDE